MLLEKWVTYNFIKAKYQEMSEGFFGLLQSA